MNTDRSNTKRGRRIHSVSTDKHRRKHLLWWYVMVKMGDLRMEGVGKITRARVKDQRQVP